MKPQCLSVKGHKDSPSLCTVKACSFKNDQNICTFSLLSTHFVQHSPSHLFLKNSQVFLLAAPTQHKHIHWRKRWKINADHIETLQWHFYLLKKNVFFFFTATHGNSDPVVTMKHSVLEDECCTVHIVRARTSLANWYIFQHNIFRGGHITTHWCANGTQSKWSAFFTSRIPPLLCFIA